MTLRKRQRGGTKKFSPQNYSLNFIAVFREKKREREREEMWKKLHELEITKQSKESNEVPQQSSSASAGGGGGVGGVGINKENNISPGSNLFNPNNPIGGAGGTVSSNATGLATGTATSITNPSNTFTAK